MRRDQGAEKLTPIGDAYKQVSDGWGSLIPKVVQENFAV